VADKGNYLASDSRITSKAFSAIESSRKEERASIPSCHQKRVIEFGEWPCQEVIKAVPHRHFILSIPKILRRYFLYDRDLLSDLSRCGWPPAPLLSEA